MQSFHRMAVVGFFIILALSSRAEAGVRQAATAQLTDGRPQLFLVSSSGQLWSSWKVTHQADAAWTDWFFMPNNPPQYLRQVSAARLSDGRPQLFTIDSLGQLWSSWKATVQADAAWTQWILMPNNPPAYLQQVFAGQLTDGRPQLFAVDSWGQLWSSWKATTQADAAWTQWILMPNNPPPYLRQAFAAQLTDGRPQLFAVDASGQLWSSWKATTQADAAWTAWILMPNNPPAYLQQVSVGQLTDGRPQLFAVDASGQLWSSWKATTQADAAWTQWILMQNNPPPYLRQAFAAQLTDGRPQLFAVDASGQLWSSWKATTQADAAWTAWIQMPL